MPFSNAPGIAYEYSNYGFAILGRIVSAVSGVKYEDYVTANVLAPLGMSSTTLEPSDGAGEPAGARLPLGRRAVEGRAAAPHGSFGSMGGMLTSVRDLSRYVGAFLSAWPPHDGPETAPIRRASLREMQQLWRPAPATVSRDSSGAVQFTRRRLRHSVSVSPKPAASATSSSTAAACPDSGRSCAGCRIRRRHHRVRQPDVHRLGPHRRDGARCAGQEWWDAGAAADAVAGADARHATRCRG